MNEEQKQMAVSILKRVLGSPKKDYKNLLQYEFNCPTAFCKTDSNKFNLGYNCDKGVFRCWKCNYKGVIHSLVSDYGTKEDAERLNLIIPKHNFSSRKVDRHDLILRDEVDVVCELPEGFIPLSKKTNAYNYMRAMAYLKGRNVSEDIIEKYNIGYTEAGPRAYRIIIPSYNQNGKLNYYEARAYLPWIKPAYHKPDTPHKNDIIFNSKNINFNLPVFLVEGVFDMFPMYNSVPLLGKDISPLLLSKLVTHNTRVVICLDEDAIQDSIVLYNRLMSYGLDVWLVEVKGDIAEYYQKKGKEELIKLLSKKRKLDFNYIMELNMKDSRLGRKRFDEKYIELEWNKLQQQFKNMEYENQQGKFN
jgi:DNA primase